MDWTILDGTLLQRAMCRGEEGSTEGSPGVFLGTGAESHSRNGATEHSCFKMQGTNKKFEL